MAKLFTETKFGKVLLILGLCGLVALLSVSMFGEGTRGDRTELFLLIFGVSSLVCFLIWGILNLIYKSPKSVASNASASQAQVNNTIETAEQPQPNYDAILSDVAKWVVFNQTCDMESLEKQFAIGFSRVIRLYDQLETLGIIKATEQNRVYSIEVKEEAVLIDILSSHNL